MKLYLLRPVEDLEKKDDPWEPWYDKCFGMVIRAEDEEAARKLANENASCENDMNWDYSIIPPKPLSVRKAPWLTNAYSSCIELIPEGPEEVIIKDEKYA